MRKAMFILAMVLPAVHSMAQIAGCTDPLALNFNPSASENDGSCTYASASLKPTLSWILPAELDETSGLIIWEENFWTHNDDTDVHLYRLQQGNFSSFQTYVLNGVTNTDWEEIAQDDQYIYIGDFGNNATGKRKDLHILRIKKNSLPTQMTVIDTIWFTYENQVFIDGRKSTPTDFDCEAFIIGRDSIYLFSKEWISEKTSVYSLPKTPGNHIARYQNNYNVDGLITGAAYLKDSQVVILTGYSSLLQPFLFFLYDFSGHHFFSGNKRRVSLEMPFHQVEGIATTDGLNVYVSNERFTQSVITIEQKLHYLDVSTFLGDYLSKLTRLERETDISDVQIYPNPFGDVLQIKADPLLRTNFELINMLGSRILNGQFEGETTIPTDHLSPGIYIMKMTYGKNMILRKMIKSR